MNNCQFRTVSNIYVFIKNAAFLHTSSCCAAKQTSAIRKVFGGSKKERAYYKGAAALPSVYNFTNGSVEGKNSKRANVLNKIFMRNITDLMATGECSKDLVGHGIEINKVSVTSDYKVLRVYWTSKGQESEGVLENLLNKNAGLLRHELSQLRIMGVVPIIQFVKDRYVSQMIEIDKRLAVADFGEDYAHPQNIHKIRSELQLFINFDDKTKADIQKLECENAEDLEQEPPLPTMPQNTLGLDREAILKRILKVTKKSEKKDWPENFTSSLVSVNDDPVTYENHQKKREAFRKFLQQREALREKARRQKNEKHRQLLDYQLSSESYDMPYTFDNNLHFEDDFIEDDDNEKI